MVAFPRFGSASCRRWATGMAQCLIAAAVVLAAAATAQVYEISGGLGQLESALLERIGAAGAREIEAHAAWIGDETRRFQTITLLLIGGMVVAVLTGAAVMIDYLEHRRRAEKAVLEARAVAEQARREAERASAAKTEFLAAVSHEMRTPLTAILGYAERLLAESPRADQRRSLESIEAAGVRLLAVIDDVLALSHIEDGRLKIASRPFGLKTLLADAVAAVAPAAEAKGLALRMVMDPELPKAAIGDPDRLRQALHHLLDNAVKFTAEGEIVLRAQPVPGAAPVIRFSVTDTGPGVPESERAATFKRFYQAESGLDRPFTGTGLGLPIAEGLVEAMGGRMGLESPEAGGARFWFTLPLVPSEEIATAPSADAPPLSETVSCDASGGDILVADDLEQNRDLIGAMLEAAGHRVSFAADGREAVAALQAGRFDLVLMDVQMPGMDGLAATKAIRALPPPARNVPIVAMTANVLPEQVAAFRAAGMDDHLGKPFKRAQILQTVSAWIRADRKEAPASTEPDALAELRQLMGAEWVTQGLTRLEEALADTFGEGVSLPDEQLAPAAHKLVTHAAMFGFQPLSQACSALEEACRRGGDVATALAQTRTLAEAARKEITRLKG